MKDFQYYLDNIGEIGYVAQNIHSLVYVSGLPGAHPNEVVIFENAEEGLIISASREHLEILVFGSNEIRVGSKVVRTNEHFTIGVGNGLLGRLIDPLGVPLDQKGATQGLKPSLVDINPPKIVERQNIEKPLLTGVTMVDLVLPLGRGQRELVIGDRKSGKTEFLLQTVLSQARLGTVCIYAVIGQNQIDIRKLYEFFILEKIDKSTILVASGSSDSSGLIFLTPYSAMTIAEYFRDNGMDVLVVLDDMTTHARNYREISLLARRFPGRSSYPGDMFYTHAKLIERAGNFKKGSITCLPVAESVLGDLSGYIQTNLMSMTDGHIFFDIELVSQGKRPAINPFLSVTRVGHQTQTPLQRDVSREISEFLVTYERMKQFMHFGAEVGDTAKSILNLGARVDDFFNRSVNKATAINVNILIAAGLWAGIWSESKKEKYKVEMEQIVLLYETDDNYKKEVDHLMETSETFTGLVTTLRRDSRIIVSKVGNKNASQ